MADERTPAEDTPTAVPSARSGEAAADADREVAPTGPAGVPDDGAQDNGAPDNGAPDNGAPDNGAAAGGASRRPADPVLDQGGNQQGTGESGGPGESSARVAEPSPGPATKATKGTKATKAAKATKGTAAKAAKAAKATEPSKATKATKATKSQQPSQSGQPTKGTKATGEPAATKSAQKASKAAKAAPHPAAETDAPALIEHTEPAGQVRPAPAGSVPAWGSEPLPSAAAPGAWAAAVRDALQQPDEPPRQLAELAVAELGPRAAAWAGWLRATYPDAPDHGIARLATRQATRGGLALALAEAGGPAIAPLRLPAAAWVRVTVILRVAAAYGHDPTDPRRAADLVELLGLDPATTGEPFSLAGLGSVAGAAGQLGVARFAVSRFGLRRTPAATMLRALIAASDHCDSLTRLAHRAARRFRPHP